MVQINNYRLCGFEVMRDSRNICFTVFFSLKTKVEIEKLSNQKEWSDSWIRNLMVRLQSKAYLIKCIGFFLILLRKPKNLQTLLSIFQFFFKHLCINITKVKCIKYNFKNLKKTNRKILIFVQGHKLFFR